MTEFYRDKRVLITGGLGFIGSNLALALVRRGARVTLVDSMIPQYGASLANVAEFRDEVFINFSDVRDPYSLNHLVRGQDCLFCLAGQVSHIDSMRDPLTDLEINCRSQLSLLECCRRENPQARLVFASTRQIYGRPQFLPVTEEHPLIPADVNGVNKLAAELYYTLYHRVYGLRTVCLRLTNTYGPRMDLRSPHKGFVGVFVRRALQQKRIEHSGGGSQRRAFNHVDDVVRGLLLAGESERLWGGSFNLGHPRPCSLREFAEMLRRFADFELVDVPFPEERAAIDIGDYYGDFSRFRELTGWSPAVGLEEGLADTFDYFRGREEAWRDA